MGRLHDLFERRRPLWMALAHSMAGLKLGNSERLAMLNRIYSTLRIADAIACRGELLECREARRGQRRAEIVA